MNTEDASVHQRSQAETIEHLHALLPHVHRPELAQALVVEAVHLRDLTTLVVSA